MRPYESCTHPKDLPVLGVALETKVDYLITLDRRHLLSPALLSKIKKLKIILPADFLKNVYLKGKI